MNDLTSGEITAILLGLGGLITATAGAIVTVLVAIKTSKKVDENTAITSEVKETAAVIQGHVNSEQTRAQSEILTLKEQVALLKGFATERSQIAALLAQATAGEKKAIQPLTTEQPLLEKIEKHTDQTVQNTTK